LAVFGGEPGSARYTIDVGGGFLTLGPYNFTVTPGEAGAFVTYGNNESENPGAMLSTPLVALLQGARNSLGLIPVVWEPVIAGTVTITNASTATDLFGYVSATVTLSPTAAGTVQVRLRRKDGQAQTIFTIYVNSAAVTGLMKISGDQEVAPGGVVARPLVVQVKYRERACSRHSGAVHRPLEQERHRPDSTHSRVIEQWSRYHGR